MIVTLMEAVFVKEALADFHKINKDQFIIGNGSNEIIELLAHVFISENDEVLFGEHSFVVYRLVTLLMGGSQLLHRCPIFWPRLKLNA